MKQKNNMPHQTPATNYSGDYEDPNTPPQKSKCNCACHENKLGKPYEHDTKCCDYMNGNVSPQKNTWSERFDKEFYEVMGLEVDPDGEDGMYLIRDEDGVILHGIDFTDEKEKLKPFISLIRSEAIQEERERIRDGLIDIAINHTALRGAVTTNEILDFLSNNPTEK